MSDNAFRQPPDLDDPRQLVGELNAFADGMEQQIGASGRQTASGGHPNPAFFFGRSAAVMRAAAALIAKSLPPETGAPATPPPSGTDDASSDPPKGPSGPGVKKK